MAGVRQIVAGRGRRTIRLPEDKQWLTEALLAELARKPSEDFDLAYLLRDMAKNSHLYRVRRGRYVIAPDGTFTVQQAASAGLVADLILSDQGDYYISHLSALIAHRLTDMHSSEVFATIRQSSTFTETYVELPMGQLRIVRIADDRWPAARSIERVRALDGTREFVQRATIELALVDSIARPEYSAGIETVVSAWTRALRHEVDWNEVASIASRRGDSDARRVAYLLKLIGKDDVVTSVFPDMTGRGQKVLFDRSKSFGEANSGTRDSQTGVVINVPLTLLQAWARPSAG